MKAKFFLFSILTVIHNDIFPMLDHLKLLHSKYPYALLGDDFGVLNGDDLATNACIAVPSPFSEESISYPYWQCFETKRSKLFCDGRGYDEDEKTFLTVLVISADRNRQHHEYITRRAIPYDDCQSFAKDWKRLTQNENYVCVSGPFTEITKDENGRKFFLWTFDKFKTKKGCAPYFAGGCSLKYQLKHKLKCDLYKYSQPIHQTH